MVITTIELAGQLLELCPERAVFWPAQRTLLIADVHLGKDQVFRSHGVAVPAGMVAADLERLTDLVDRTGAERLIVLGDWVHAPPGPGEPWPEQIHAWRDRHRTLSVELVQGNHDRALATWLTDWSITDHGERFELAGLVLIHEWHPGLSGPGLSGHLHPGAVIRAGHERLRLPAFLRAGDHLVVPAFGRFTGLMTTTPFPTQQAWVIAGKRVIGLPAAIHA